MSNNDIENTIDSCGFEIIKSVGEGGYGKVYLVKDKNSQQEMIYKYVVQKSNMDADIGFREVIETNIFFSCKNPYLLKSYKMITPLLCNTQRISYILPKYDKDLFSYCEKLNKNKTKSGYQHLINILYQTAMGIKYLHSCNIIHRDIKPENILIRKKNHKFEAVVSDFGLSIFIPSGDDDFREKRSIGTLNFMYPEISNKSNTYKIYNFQTDCWALGITLLECLFGDSFINFMNQDIKINENDTDFVKIRDYILIDLNYCLNKFIELYSKTVNSCCQFIDITVNDLKDLLKTLLDKQASIDRFLSSFIFDPYRKDIKLTSPFYYQIPFQKSLADIFYKNINTLVKSTNTGVMLDALIQTGNLVMCTLYYSDYNYFTDIKLKPDDKTITINGKNGVKVYSEKLIIDIIKSCYILACKVTGVSLITSTDNNIITMEFKILTLFNGCLYNYNLWNEFKTLTDLCDYFFWKYDTEINNNKLQNLPAISFINMISLQQD